MTVMCDSSAAYVLGALSASERAEFETHLAECADCRQSVAELAGIPGLLSRISPDDLADEPPVPDTLVPRLVRAVRRTGRRRRLAVGGLAAAAALLAVGGTLIAVDGIGGGSSGPPPQAMVAVVQSPVRATAALVSHTWGTEVTMTCTYEDNTPWSRPYALVAVDDNGTEHEIAQWSVGPSHEAKVRGSVPVQRDHIQRLEIRTVSGIPLLRLKP